MRCLACGWKPVLVIQPIMLSPAVLRPALEDHVAELEVCTLTGGLDHSGAVRRMQHSSGEPQLHFFRNHLFPHGTI